MDNEDKIKRSRADKQQRTHEIAERRRKKNMETFEELEKRKKRLSDSASDTLKSL